MKRIIILSTLVAGFGACIPAANAGDLDYSDALKNNTAVDRYHISVAEASKVTFFTSSWENGGFDPYIALWDGAGNLIREQDDNGRSRHAFSNGTSYDYGAWDSKFSALLEEGDYTLSISTRPSRAGAHPDKFDKLSDGFVFDNGAPVSFASWDQPGNGIRNGNYDLHIVNLNGTATKVPEPSTLMMLGSLAVGAAAAAFRKKAGF